MRVKIVDAFSDKPGMGNPAGVVFLKKAMPDQLMQAVARQIGVSETAFLQETQPNRFRTRFFTPQREVDICGHATIASFYTLAVDEMANKCSCLERYWQQSNVGELAIEVHRQPEQPDPLIWMQLDTPEFSDCVRSADELLRPLGLSEDNLNRELPLKVAQSNRVFIPVNSLEQLLSLQPDFTRLSDVSESWGIRGITPYTLETLDNNALTHLRHFAPVAGVNEDPITGTSNGYLAYLLLQTGIISDAAAGYIGEQGHAIGKSGIVHVRITPDGNLWIGGTACLSGELEVLEEAWLRCF